MQWMRRLVSRLDRAVGSLERSLRAVYGSAQVDPRQMGTQPERAADRLQGVGGEYEVHRDDVGRTYLVSRRTGDR